jgi:hypothetical protein
MSTQRRRPESDPDAALAVRTRKPAGAVLSVRVPRELVIAVDDYARERESTMSEVVREALERFVTLEAAHVYPTLYASVSAGSNLVLTSPEALTREPNRGEAQTETHVSELAVPA